MTSRQEIYDRIRESSKNEVILEEMIRLGFWPQGGVLESDPADELKREEELSRQLRALSTENARLGNPEALKKAARKRRMQESRQKMLGTKERRLQQRREKATAWQQKKKTDIGYLGEGVSTTLNHLESNSSQLAKHDLPKFDTVADLATEMDRPVGEIRFLAFNRRTSTTTHYRRFGIRKKSGDIRIISAPMPRLKHAQQWILLNILEKVELHRAAHGFRRGRSIVTNAQPHVKSDVVINLDLQNFFPTITFKRVRGVFRNLGYSGQLSTILACICSEPETEEIELDNRTFFVARSERRLPQGAPSSPAITNILCRGLDARLTRIAEKLGFTYTRYADDMTFSGSGDAATHVGRILRQIKHAVECEGFTVHPDKTRVFRKSRRQEVTGLVVNDGVSVNREILRRFRTTLFQIDKDGPAGKRWGQSPDVMASIEGFANFVAMVDKTKGSAFQSQVRALHTKFDYKQVRESQRQRFNYRPPVESNQPNAANAATVEPVDHNTTTERTNSTPVNKPASQSGTQPQQVPKTKSLIGRLLGLLFGRG